MLSGVIQQLPTFESFNDQDFPTSDTFKTTQNYSTVWWSGTSLPIREHNEGAVIVLKTAIY